MSEPTEALAAITFIDPMAIGDDPPSLATPDADMQDDIEALGAALSAHPEGLDVDVLGAAWLNLWGGSHESPPNDLVLIALHGMMEGLAAEYARLARSEEPT